jgi:hypothetical protein
MDPCISRSGGLGLFLDGTGRCENVFVSLKGGQCLDSSRTNDKLTATRILLRKRPFHGSSGS